MMSFFKMGYNSKECLRLSLKVYKLETQSLICHMDADLSVEGSLAIGPRVDICVAKI